MQGARARISGAWRVCGAFALLLFASRAAPAHAAASHRSSSRAEVRSVALAASRGGATLTIALDEARSYRLFTLSRPGRVVLDLSDARLAHASPLPHGDGIVRDVRSGPRPRGGLRLVIDIDPSAAPGGRLRLPVRAHWSVRGARGSRLVVTIGSAPAEARSAAVSGGHGDTAARAMPAAPHPVRATHAPKRSGRDVVIAVDAGHGGKDPGAIGHQGTEEKNVTLAIARALAARIDEEPGMRAVLTRDSDVFLSLRERIRRARAAHANLFVSIHADSIRDRGVSGASVYVLSEHGATSEAARWLAERENAADLIGGVSLADKSSTLASVLLDVTQSANISASVTAAQDVLSALDRVGEVRKAAVQQAAFVVLKSPDIPSMLVETAYISNPTEERRLRTPSQQRKLASAIFSGLLGYFEAYPPVGTRFAQMRGGSDAVLAGGNAPPTASVTR